MSTMKRLVFTTFLALVVVLLVAVLCLLLIFATGEIAVVPNDLLGEPESCFAGC